MRRSWVRRSLAGAAALILVAALVTVFLHLELQPRPHQQARRPSTAPTSAPARSAPTPAATRTPALMPGTLTIPKIGVNAPIEQVTVDRNNDMAPPKKWSDVGWYAPGVVPGQSGDAVIDGHLDWYGVPKAVFYNLKQLRAGDEVDVIDQSGAKLRFKVTDSTSVGASAHPAGLFAKTGPARLTLITCDGSWDQKAGQYTQRLLVDASYVGTG